MKYFGSAEGRLFKLWLHCGYNLKRFAIGFSIDRWGLNIDLGPLWFSIEF
jgi:hypothetical protein